MNASIPVEQASKIWGPYPNYDDIARFEYGRMLWKLPDMRARFLKHWTDDRHPYKERFLKQRELIEDVMCSTESEEELDTRLRSKGTSLRCMTREIPPVFGSFFREQRGELTRACSIKASNSKGFFLKSGLLTAFSKRGWEVLCLKLALWADCVCSL